LSLDGVEGDVGVVGIFIAEDLGLGLGLTS